jgi:uncharacterized protein YuzE
MTLTVAGIEFDHVFYDADADVLYLHVGDPADAADFDETPEGHHVRFDTDGNVTGLTLVRPSHLLHTQGSVPVTLPKRSSVEADELAPVLT